MARFTQEERLGRPGVQYVFDPDGCSRFQKAGPARLA